MTPEIRLWKVADGAVPEEVPRSQVGLEKRLEDWLEGNIAMLDPDLMVVGRQVATAYGGTIDLLCIDREGYLVVVELKQGRTPRDVAAQVLDYASWVKDLAVDDVEEIARGSAKIEGSLAEAVQARFGAVPNALCERHRAIIVAEAADDSTERIVRYLSEMGVPINFVRVHAFKDASGQEMLAQAFLVAPKDARDRAHRASNRRRYLRAGEMQALADANGIGDLYRRLKEGVAKILTSPSYYSETTGFSWRFKDNRTSTVLFVGATNPDGDGLSFTIHATRCCDCLRISIEELRAMLPANMHDKDVRGWQGSSPAEKENAVGLEGSFKTPDDVGKFVAGLRSAKDRLATD